MPSKKQNKANDGPKPVVPQQFAPEKSFLAALKKDQPAASSTPVVQAAPSKPATPATTQKPAQQQSAPSKPAPTSVWGKQQPAAAEPSAVKNVTAKPMEKKTETVAPVTQATSKPATPAAQQPAASNKSFLDAIKKPKEEKPKEVKPVAVVAAEKPAEKPATTDAAKAKPDLSVQTPAAATTTTTTTTTTDKPADDSPTSPNQQAGFTTQKNKKGGKLARTGQKIVRDKINIPPGAAAYIIGKAGANIKRINEQSGALAKVNDTIVTIQANDKDTANKAKKMVLELLRAFYARTQIQTNEFNLLMVEEDDHTRLKTQMVAYDGPLSEWLVREQIIKQEPKPAPVAAPTTTDAAATTTTTTTPAPETKAVEPAEEEAPIKRVYFMAAVQQDEDIVQEDEDDEEAEILRRMTQKGSSSSNAKKAQEKDQDKNKASQGASLTLVTGKVLKETFSSLADKLTDEKTREDEVRQLFAKKKSDDDEDDDEDEQPQQPAAAASKKTEHNPNTVDVEFILGKKLFYPNVDAKKNKKKLKNLDKIDEMPVKEFLDSKFGFGHQLNTSFNYALRSEEITKLESNLATKSEFKQSQRQIIVGRVRFNAKKYNITLEVDSRLDNNLNTFKIVEFHEKSSRLALIDFIRPYPSWLDFRIISRYYSHTIAPAPVIEFVEKRARWDSNKGEIVLLPEEKKPEEKNDKGEIVKPNKFNLVADRVKKDKVYSNGTYTIVFSATKDALKDQAKQQPKKKEKKEEVKAEENKEGAAATTPAPAPAPAQEEDDEDDDMKVDGEKKIIDSLEVAVLTSSLTYANFGDSAANSKALSDSLFWISNEFLGSQ